MKTSFLLITIMTLLFNSSGTTQTQLIVDNSADFGGNLNVGNILFTHANAYFL